VKVFHKGSIDRERPVYLGIDQSYSGFAITALQDDAFYAEVYKSDKGGIDRLRDIQSHVMNWLYEFNNVSDVAMEGYAFGSQMANMLGELGGMVKLTLLDFGIYPMIVPPTTLKKYVTGKGTGVPKSQMLLFVYKKWDVDITDDNAADSYALARLVSGYRTLAYEKEIYNKMQDPKFREK
jgi:Holliday junction resolvasome RuvABC endonuclease subunit